MNRYPWPEMQVGEVREITSDKSLSAVRSAACMWSGKQGKKMGSRPKFSVELINTGVTFTDDPMPAIHTYRVERTA